MASCTILTLNIQEASDKVVTLPEDDNHTITRVISYLYLGDYKEDGNSCSCSLCRELNPDGRSSGEPDITETLVASADTDEVPTVPCNNLRVYMESDKFGIDALKNLARDRLISWLECNLGEKFPQVVRVVMQTLPPQELQFPGRISKLISQKAGGLLQLQSMVDLLEEFPGLTVSVLKDFVQNLAAQRTRLRDTLSQAADMAGWLETLKSKTDSLDECRHCAEPFNIRLDQRNYNIIRCKSCGTRN